MEIIYFILIANCISFHTVSLFLFSTAKLEKKETECNLIKLDFSIILTIGADKSVRLTECRNTPSVGLFEDKNILYRFAEIACDFQRQRCRGQEMPPLDSHNRLPAYAHSLGKLLLRNVVLGTLYLNPVFHRRTLFCNAQS